MNNKKYIDFLFSNHSISQIQNFLSQNPNVNLMEFKDDKKNNILHQSAFQNKLYAMKIYIQHMTRFYQTKSNNEFNHNIKNTKKIIIAWINEQNGQGFAPLHYASFKGNLQMIKFLQQLGASLVLQTKLGLNLIHLAAQGDRLNVLLYLYDKFDINSIDSKKGTALHWSCYMGSQNVVAFLLTLDCLQIDSFDSDQQTPLHLATQYGNTRIVRKLLIKGADRSLRNGKGQTAIQIARQNEFKNIQKMLNEQFTLFDQIKFYCNLKIQYKPTDRSIIL